MLYQWDVGRGPMESVIADFWKVRSTAEATMVLAERLARGAQQHSEAIDALIARTATHWRFDRIAAVDRALLRLGAYELLHEPQTPAPVIIDEAVELAKRFSEADAPGFVNGVLDAIMREVRKVPGDEGARRPGRRRGKA